MTRLDDTHLVQEVRRAQARLLLAREVAAAIGDRNVTPEEIVAACLKCGAVNLSTLTEVGDGFGISPTDMKFAAFALVARGEARFDRNINLSSAETQFEDGEPTYTDITDNPVFLEKISSNVRRPEVLARISAMIYQRYRETAITVRTFILECIAHGPVSWDEIVALGKGYGFKEAALCHEINNIGANLDKPGFLIAIRATPMQESPDNRPKSRVVG
jgi:hypothetical protein